MAKTTSSKTAESLIDVLAEQVAREEAMLNRIREAHAQGDVATVMQFLSELFAGSGTGEGDDHDQGR